MFDPDNDWRWEMYALARKDPWCQARAKKIDEFEPGYLALRKKLTAKEWNDLEMYIAACEEMKYSYIYPAYELGRLHERQLREKAEI